MAAIEWSISIWDAMKAFVNSIIIPCFQILQGIPIGFMNASVFDFMVGIVVIGIAVSFFWRAGAATEGIASVKLADAKRESFFQQRMDSLESERLARQSAWQSERLQRHSTNRLSRSLHGNYGKASYWNGRG